jgi:hypothetical protein
MTYREPNTDACPCSARCQEAQTCQGRCFGSAGLRGAVQAAMQQSKTMRRALSNQGRVGMSEPSEEEIARAAKEIASWHGQKIALVRQGEALTIAAMAGFGSWGDSPQRYADAHWRQYSSAAEWHLNAIRHARAQGMREAAEILRPRHTGYSHNPLKGCTYWGEHIAEELWQNISTILALADKTERGE